MYDHTKPKLPEGTEIVSLVDEDNIADLLDDECLNHIGQMVVEEYDADEASRGPWLERYNRALKLAMQVVEVKDSPWPNASNVKFPSMTLAAITFHARAYPSLIPSRELVHVKKVGSDPLGFKRRRAERIKTHLNYQFLDQMEEWEEDMDRLLITLPITGSEFKKSFFSPTLGRNVSKHVHAKDLVVDYFAKNLETAARVTEIMSMSSNELEENFRAGVFLSCDFTDSAPRDDNATDTSDKVQGKEAPSADVSTDRMVLEQHRYLDLDCDGYAEPYIVTVDYNSAKVLRITARFKKEDVKQGDGEIKKITPECYYTKYPFIPSPDGGFYDIGFGTLIGPINDAINTLINQLIDAGTLSNLQSGFISKSLRIKKGNGQFKPGEWKEVNATGQDIRQGLIPLPVREPSLVLFQLLGLLVDVGQKITSTTDIMVGESPGQNQKATTTQAVVENGLKVFTAIYKRLRRSLTKEIKRVYLLNKYHLDEKEYFNIIDPDEKEMQEYKVYRRDYETDTVDILPTADPNATSPMQKMERAMFLRESLATGLPLDPVKVTIRVLEAAEIENPQELLLSPEQLNQPPMEMMLKDRQLTIKEQDSQAKNSLKARDIQIKELKTLAEIRQKDEQIEVDAEDKHRKGVLQAIDISERSRTEQKKIDAKPKGESK